MDFLKAEIANKRKALTEDDRPRKYMRKGEVERLEREEQAKSKENELIKAAASPARSPAPATASAAGSPAPDGNAPTGELAHVPLAEILRRLRQKGQPITLFGESDRSRRLRLRALELIEERAPDRGAGMNDFKRALEVSERSAVDADAAKGAKGKGAAGGDKAEEEKKTEKEVEEVRLEWIKEQPEKLHPAIYYALKKMLKEWEEAMGERPDAIKRSMQGKLAAATQVQSAEYLKPLFKQLRTRTLPDDMLARLAEIVYHMQQRQYQRANDSYLRLSIGNAAWPIGVTMVGIHERSAREKISSDQVAHVLNDEVSRKYIQSVKRLLTFAQTKYPPEDISQLMG